MQPHLTFPFVLTFGADQRVAKIKNLNIGYEIQLPGAFCWPRDLCVLTLSRICIISRLTTLGSTHLFFQLTLFCLESLLQSHSHWCHSPLFFSLSFSFLSYLTDLPPLIDLPLTKIHLKKLKARHNSNRKWRTSRKTAKQNIIQFSLVKPLSLVSKILHSFWDASQILLQSHMISKWHVN